MSKISFLCPTCNEPIKVDSAQMDTLERSCMCVPARVADQLIGKEVVCDQCFSSFAINQRPYDFVILELVGGKGF